MRFAVNILFAFLIFSSFFPKRDPWFARDKVLHFSVSFTIYNFAYVGSGSNAKSAVITLSIGIFKEIVDLTIRKTGFSYKDLIYDILGVLVAEST